MTSTRESILRSYPSWMAPFTGVSTSTLPCEYDDWTVTNRRGMEGAESQKTLPYFVPKSIVSGEFRPRFTFTPAFDSTYMTDIWAVTTEFAVKNWLIPCGAASMSGDAVIADVFARVVQQFMRQKVAATSAATVSASPCVERSSLQEEALVDAVRRIFPDAKVSRSVQSDQEEGWSRPLIRVETGIDDFEKLYELEQKFYEEVERHETLISALNLVTVFFE